MPVGKKEANTVLFLEVLGGQTQFFMERREDEYIVDVEMKFFVHHVIGIGGWRRAESFSGEKKDGAETF